MITAEMSIRRLLPAHGTQKKEWDCAITTLQMTHRALDEALPSESTLVQALSATSEFGVNGDCMDAYLDKADISHTVYTGTSIEILQKGLSQGNAYIVEYQQVADGDIPIKHDRVTWSSKRIGPVRRDFDDGHVGIIAAITKGYVFVLDPALGTSIGGLPKGIRPIPTDLFENRWIDREEDGTIFRKFAIEIPLCPGRPALWLQNWIRSYLLHPRRII